MSIQQTVTSSIKIKGIENESTKQILSAEALRFVSSLHRQFNQRRLELLHFRQERQRQLDVGGTLDFLEETKSIRESTWEIAPLPEDLQDRRVEITGPVSRKMVINALNSGAKLFMACFEDATSPTWENMIDGQVNLFDAIRKTISYSQSSNGKVYRLNDKVATLIVRPRGLHMEERHIEIDGEPVAGSFFDFGLYFFHNAKELIAQGTGPYFYLPKLESHLEARLWNDIFNYSEKYMELAKGTIKATVLIETITAAFEMDEILYELKEHSAGLNCGRWDYIFSYIKRLRNHHEVILPDRSQVTMNSPFMRAYTQLCIHTCHKRNAPAMGGMAAQIPIKDNPQANELAFEKVREDKMREAKDGHDGTWVAHPGLVQVAMEQFDYYMKTPNQIHRKRNDMHVTAADLLEVPIGSITEEGVRLNCSVGVQYIASWLRGNGAVPIYNMMEDAATAEISRTQIWQWIRHEKGNTIDGQKIDAHYVQKILEEEVSILKNQLGEENYVQSRLDKATDIFKSLILQDTFEEFLTIPSYQSI